MLTGSGRRLLGALLLLLTLAPLYRLLDPRVTGLAGASTREQLGVYSDFAASGSLLVGAIALLAALVLGPEWITRLRARLVVLERPSAVAYAAALALAAGILSAAFAYAVLDGVPNHLDSIAQLLHARVWADGRLTGPGATNAEFWLLQNSVFTSYGWVSQYPPGHVALLTLGLLAGAPALVGPLLVALAVFTWTLCIDRLFAHDLIVARLGALLLALSPFFLCLGGSFMNHVTVAAMLGAAAYCGLRALQGSPWWALLAGFALSYAFATRPLSSLAIGLALALTLPAAAGRRILERSTLLRALLLLIGTVPVLALLFSYNHALFGGWWRTGYELALGPRTGLGFHLDPWGNQYGLREAIAWTSADLTALGVHLLESPLPAVAVIGAYLVLARALGPAVRVILASALAAVAANGLYWHHGLYMGPRMLHEAAPLWIMLFTIAAIGIVRRIPASLAVLNLNVRSGVASALLLATAGGVLLLAPQRAASYGGAWLAVTRVSPPQPTGPALVFVHDAWTARVGMTLAASGFRLDQVETLLRQNSTCRVHMMATARPEAVPGLLAQLDTIPRADRLPGRVEIVPGDAFRALPGERLTPECIAEVRSDRFGILDLAPLAWRGDLPHDDDGTGVLFVRDLGPLRNGEIIARYPQRTPYLFVMSAPDGEPLLVPYAEGMQRLWSAQ